jgi:hypothetical protein
VEIRLTGGKALAVAALALGVVAFQYLHALNTLDTEGEAVLRRWIGTEYQRYQLQRAGLDDEQRAKLLLSLESLTLRDLSARGTLDDLIVRVEIEPHPAQPPGVDPVRYFRMRHSTASGWLTPERAYAHNYYLKLF